MFPSGAVLKGGNHFPGFPPGQMMLPDCLHQPILVAALQPGQFHPKRSRQKTQSDALLRFIAQPLDEREPPAYPALVAAKKNSDLRTFGFMMDPFQASSLWLSLSDSIQGSIDKFK